MISPMVSTSYYYKAPTSVESAYLLILLKGPYEYHPGRANLAKKSVILKSACSGFRL